MILIQILIENSIQILINIINNMLLNLFYFFEFICQICDFKIIQDNLDFGFEYMCKFDFFSKILEVFSNIYLMISGEEIIPRSDRILTPPRSPVMPETDSSFFGSSPNINSEDISSESSEDEDDGENSSSSSWFEIYIKNPIKRFLCKFGIINAPVVEESNLLSSTTETLNSSLFPNQNGDLRSNSVLSSENLASSSTETTERRTSWVEYLFLRPFEYVMGKLGFDVKKTTDIVETDVVPTTNSSISVDPLSETMIDDSEVVPQIVENLVVSEIVENAPVVSERTEEVTTVVTERIQNSNIISLISSVLERITMTRFSRNLPYLDLDSNMSTAEVHNFEKALNVISHELTYRLNQFQILLESVNSSDLLKKVKPDVLHEISQLNETLAYIQKINKLLLNFNLEDGTEKNSSKVDLINNYRFKLDCYDKCFKNRFVKLTKKIAKALWAKH